jgi:hypothetical protein
MARAPQGDGFDVGPEFLALRADLAFVAVQQAADVGAVLDPQNDGQQKE